MKSRGRWQSSGSCYREESHLPRKRVSRSEEQRRHRKRRVFKEPVVQATAIRSVQRQKNIESDSTSSLDGIPMDEQLDTDDEFACRDGSQPGPSSKEDSYLFPDHCWVGEYLDDGEENTVPLTYDKTTKETMHQRMSEVDAVETRTSTRPELEYMKRVAPAIFPDEQELDALRRERLMQSEMTRRSINEYSATNSLSSAQILRSEKLYRSLGKSAAYDKELERMHDEMVQRSHPNVPPSRIFDYGHGAASTLDRDNSETNQLERRRQSCSKAKQEEYRKPDKRISDNSMNPQSSRPVFPLDRDFTYEELLEMQRSLRERPQPISTVPVRCVSGSRETNFIPVHDTNAPSPKGLPISVLTTNYRLQQDSTGSDEDLSHARNTSAQLQKMQAKETPLRIKPVFKNFSKHERKFNEAKLSKQITSEYSKSSAFRGSFNDTRKVLVDDEKIEKDDKYRKQPEPRSTSRQILENPMEAFFVKSAPMKSVSTQELSRVDSDKRQFGHAFPFFNKSLEDDDKKSDDSDDDMHARFLHRRSRSHSPRANHLKRSHSTTTSDHNPHRKQGNRDDGPQKTFSPRLARRDDHTSYSKSREKSVDRKHRTDRPLKKKRTQETRLFEPHQINVLHPRSSSKKALVSRTPERSKRDARSEKSRQNRSLHSGEQIRVRPTHSPARSRHGRHSEKSEHIRSSHSSKQSRRVQSAHSPVQSRHESRTKSHQIKSLLSTEETQIVQNPHSSRRSRHDSDFSANSERTRAMRSTERTLNDQSTHSSRHARTSRSPRKFSRSPVQLQHVTASYESEKRTRPASRLSERSQATCHSSERSRRVINASHSRRRSPEMRSSYSPVRPQRSQLSRLSDQSCRVPFNQSSATTGQNRSRSPQATASQFPTTSSDQRRVQRMQSPLQSQRFRRSRSASLSSVLSDISLSPPPRRLERSPSPAIPWQIRSSDSLDNQSEGKGIVDPYRWDGIPLRSVEREASDCRSIDISGSDRTKRSRKYSDSETDNRMVERIVVPSHKEKLNWKYEASIPSLMDAEPIPSLLSMDIGPVRTTLEKEFEDGRKFESFDRKKLLRSSKTNSIEQWIDQRRFQVTSGDLETLQPFHFKRTISQEVPKEKTEEQADTAQKLILNKKQNIGKTVLKDASGKLQPGNKKVQNRSPEPATTPTMPGKTTVDHESTVLPKSAQVKLGAKISTRKSATLTKARIGLPLSKTKAILSSRKAKGETRLLKTRMKAPLKTVSKARVPLKRKMIEPVTSNVKVATKAKQPGTGEWLEDYKLWFQETMQEILSNSVEAEECGLLDPMRFLESITIGNRKSMSYIPRGAPAKEILKFISINKKQRQSSTKNDEDSSKLAADSGSNERQQKDAIDKQVAEQDPYEEILSPLSKPGDPQTCTVVSSRSSKVDDSPSCTKSEQTTSSSISADDSLKSADCIVADKNPVAISEEKKPKEVAEEKEKELVEENAHLDISKANREYHTIETDAPAAADGKELHRPTSPSISVEANAEPAAGKDKFRSWQDALSFPEDEQKFIVRKDSETTSEKPPPLCTTSSLTQLEKSQVMKGPKVQIRNIFSPAAMMTKKTNSSKSKEVKPSTVVAKTTQQPNCKESGEVQLTRKPSGKTKHPAAKTARDRVAKKKMPPKSLPKKTESKNAASEKSSVEAAIKSASSRTEDAPLDDPMKTTENISQKSGPLVQNVSKIVMSEPASIPEKCSTPDIGAASKGSEKDHEKLSKPASDKRKSFHSDSTSRDVSQNAPKRKSSGQSSSSRKSTNKPQSRTHEPADSKTKKPSSSNPKTTSTIERRVSRSKAEKEVNKAIEVPITEPSLTLEQESLLPAFKKQVEKSVLRKLNILYQFEKYRKSIISDVAKDVLQVFSRGHTLKEVKFTTEQALYYMQCLFENPTMDALDDIDRQLKKVGLEEPCFNVDEKAFFLFHSTVMELCHQNLNSHTRYTVQDPVRTRYVRLLSEHLFPQFDGEAHVLIKVWNWRGRMNLVVQHSYDSTRSVKPFPDDHSGYKSMEDRVGRWLKDVLKCPLYEYPEMSSCNVVSEVKRQLMKRKAHATKQEAVALIARAWLKNYFRKIEKSLQSKGFSLKKTEGGSEEELMVVDEVYSDASGSGDEDQAELGMDIAEDLTGVQVIDLF